MQTNAALAGVVHTPEEQLQRCWLHARVPVARIRSRNADPLAFPAPRSRVARVHGVDAEPQNAVVLVDLHQRVVEVGLGPTLPADRRLSFSFWVI